MVHQELNGSCCSYRSGVRIEEELILSRETRTIKFGRTVKRKTFVENINQVPVESDLSPRNRYCREAIMTRVRQYVEVKLFMALIHGDPGSTHIWAERRHKELMSRALSLSCLAECGLAEARECKNAHRN